MDEAINTSIQISSQAIDIAKCMEWARDEQCGGIHVFIGTVRNSTSQKKVVRLEFEAYEKMANSEMKHIADEVFQKFPVIKILIHHRTGVLQIGEVPVVIAVSAAHRSDAFDACRYAIDKLKQTVPIWKKEVFEDGEVWVAAHP